MLLYIACVRLVLIVCVELLCYDAYSMFWFECAVILLRLLYM